MHHLTVTENVQYAKAILMPPNICHYFWRMTFKVSKHLAVIVVRNSYLYFLHPLLVREDGLLALDERRGQARVELVLLSPHLFLLLPQRLLQRLAP